VDDCGVEVEVECGLELARHRRPPCGRLAEEHAVRADGAAEFRRELSPNGGRLRLVTHRDDQINAGPPVEAPEAIASGAAHVELRIDQISVGSDCDNRERRQRHTERRRRLLCNSASDCESVHEEGEEETEDKVSNFDDFWWISNSEPLRPAAESEGRQPAALITKL
jgi:hypothetical protein